ncbi:TetR/AcrR family transcriptional regulator [Klebsiella pasteurii]|uniref:TetR/AcrR family transcriptional regulator n=1 Tax=Klebsiella pasteurii TaxID=2587529 RepID=UPI00116BB162|nr:TetR/AcrR family transcriptional regulator [Klebsiella pasteurii]VUT06056.1 hypothetical protein SB6416_02458 [Klebsiella pasteurii]
MNSKRKIQLADFNRKVILTTSNTLFLNRGIESTTMDEIAHEAGFRKQRFIPILKIKKTFWIILSWREWSVSIRR